MSDLSKRQRTYSFEEAQKIIALWYHKTLNTSIHPELSFDKELGDQVEKIPPIEGLILEHIGNSQYIVVAVSGISFKRENNDLLISKGIIDRLLEP